MQLKSHVRFAFAAKGIFLISIAALSCAHIASGSDVLFLEAQRRYEEVQLQHSKFMEVNGVRLQYLEWDAEGGMPLIWLHGYGSTAFEIAEFAPELNSMGYHVYAITYRGHGHSRVSDYEFSVYTIADDIAEFMRLREIPCATIGGWSLGGVVASAFFSSYEHRANALALVDGGAIWAQLLSEAYAVMQEKNDGAETQQPAPVSDPVKKVFDSRLDGARWVADAYFSDYVRPFDDVLLAYAYSFLVKNEAERWELHYDHAQIMGSWADLDDPVGSHRLKLLPRSHRSVLPEVIYRNLDIPMLLIDPTGDDEKLFSRSPEYRRLAQQHSRWIEYVEYPDTPHAAHLNRPDWFLRDMKSLLGRTDKESCDY